MRRDFIFRAAITHAIPAASLLLDGFKLAIQKFNLLLLLVDRLIELINQVFGKAEFNFKTSDAIFAHINSSIFSLGINQFKSTIFHFRFGPDPKVVRLERFIYVGWL